MAYFYSAAYIPFVTSVSPLADQSLVQPPEHQRQDILRNLYRRRIWVGGPAAQDAAVLRNLEKTLADDARAYGMIWAALAEIQLKP